MGSAKALSLHTSCAEILRTTAAKTRFHAPRSAARVLNPVGVACLQLRTPQTTSFCFSAARACTGGAVPNPGLALAPAHPIHRRPAPLKNKKRRGVISRLSINRPPLRGLGSCSNNKTDAEIRNAKIRTRRFSTTACHPSSSQFLIRDTRNPWLIPFLVVAPPAGSWSCSDFGFLSGFGLRISDFGGTFATGSNSQEGVGLST